MKAEKLLKVNIDTLLRARRQTRHDLAVWCRRSDAWLSKILSDSPGNTQGRDIPLKYLDRIADFFGIAAYQLFQPGISPLTERRKAGDRRSGRDRRLSAMNQQVRESLASAVATLTAEDVADLIRWRTLDAESRATLRTEIHALARSERQTVARVPRRRRAETVADQATAPPVQAGARRRGTGSD